MTHRDLVLATRIGQRGRWVKGPDRAGILFSVAQSGAVRQMQARVYRENWRAQSKKAKSNAVTGKWNVESRAAVKRA